MTFEEIQRTIEQMLAVQRELQESQVRLQENQIRDTERFNQQVADLRAIRAEETEHFNQQITRMLAIQRELQEGQLRLQSGQNNFQEGLITLREEQTELTRREGVLIDEIHRLVEISSRHENRINQLIGYSITDESDRYHLMERVQDLERRLRQIEDQQNGS